MLPSDRGNFCPCVRVTKWPGGFLKGECHEASMRTDIAIVAVVVGMFLAAVKPDASEKKSTSAPEKSRCPVGGS